MLHGEVPETVDFEINGLRLHADLEHGQKTGIFLDQRENYVAAARYARGHALDCFTSSGGFALHMARQCESVEAIDSSAAAIATARRNAEANGIENVALAGGGCVRVALGYTSKKYDTIVLDPPAFTKSAGKRGMRHCAGIRRSTCGR